MQPKPAPVPKLIRAPFVPTLAPDAEVAKIAGGYSGGPGVSMSSLSDGVFGFALPGEWLSNYMLRRFGWPNAGSDPHKSLGEWVLTTPVPGLYLAVYPSLGKCAVSPCNMHFGVRYTGEVGEQFDLDRGVESVRKRRSAAMLRWWKTKGSKLYAWGCAKKTDADETMVHSYGASAKDPDVFWGIFKRKPVHGKRYAKLPCRRGVLDGMFMWWLGEFLKKSHPEVHLPVMTKRERMHRKTRFQRRALNALRQTLLALLVPTSIRDFSFNAAGPTFSAKAIAQHPKSAVAPVYFAGAGNTPRYWFTEGGGA